MLKAAALSGARALVNVELDDLYSLSPLAPYLGPVRKQPAFLTAAPHTAAHAAQPCLVVQTWLVAPLSLRRCRGSWASCW